MTDSYDRLSSPRILAGMPADIELVFGSNSEDLPDPTAAGTVVITDEDGNTVVASSAPDIVAGRARLRKTLTGAQLANVNLLTATWAGITWQGEAGLSFETNHEVVRSFLFTIDEARRWDNGALKDEEEYPFEELRWARDRITDAFCDILKFELGRRARRDIVDGPGESTLWLNRTRVHSLRSTAIRASGSTSWTALTSGELADVQVSPHGRLVRESLGSWTAGYRNVKTVVEVGADPIPLELKRAGLMVLREAIVNSDLPMRATSQSSEIGSFSLATAGLRGSFFGIPLVDEVLERLRDKTPSVA